ncbi:RNase P Rpr2/Rpp21 subunit domain protein [Senna tora]|uniref:RNase P Rpr2/Rpp21 subunit domain protein n=1 Tax=Senna tora TaxID=362788 RepID=A0A834SYH6_9FABA|nr:RNase P Rpr2/Rpp21 subunit domain protein [Senna tora]
MGKKGGAKRLLNSTTRSRNPVSLREEATGKLQTKASTNVKSKLKLEHLKNLAVWASSEASIPSLGAFYGQCFASVQEAIGVPPDPSLITCQRCETVLHPGSNCTIRIEKKRVKSKHRRKKLANVNQNNVVYKCHFCSYQNQKRGTPKGHMKGICPSKEKSSEESKLQKTILHQSSRLEEGIIKKDEANETDMFASRASSMDVPVIDSPATPPSLSLNTGLLGGKKRKGIDAGKTISTSSKRRRKSWTGLKETAQNSENNNSRVVNLSIPFFL